VSGLLTLDPRHSSPLHVQLEQGIRALIAQKKLGPGDQLPTVRQLAVDLSINANTVARVYVDLERAGVLETRRGVGTFVASQPALIAHKAGHREKELAALVRRCLIEAAAQGFSADDVVREMKNSTIRK
jgi:GntR family transcriptional regulator